MSLQSRLNQEALEMVPNLHHFLKLLEKDTKNQAVHIAINEILNSYKPIDTMTLAEIEEFSAFFIDFIEYRLHLK